MDECIQKKVNAFVRNHSKSDLLKICKEKNLDTNGTKFDMTLRILNINFNHEQTHKNKINGNNEQFILRIKKNEFGNYTHNESLMVFDPNTKKVIGAECPNGNIRPLNRNDIEICQKYKFQYNLPISLDPSPIFEIFENSDNEKNSDKNEYSDIDDIEEEDDDEKNEENELL